METFFWLLIFIVFYGYVGYPLLLAVMAPLFGRFKNLPQSTSEYPSVSILVPAYNEADYIRIKIDSLLNQKYPAPMIFWFSAMQIMNGHQIH